jgi:hypothetical protein
LREDLDMAGRRGRVLGVLALWQARAATPLLQLQAQVHGYEKAFWLSAAIFAVGAVLTAILLRPGVLGAEPAAASVQCSGHPGLAARIRRS